MPETSAVNDSDKIQDLSRQVQEISIVQTQVLQPALKRIEVVVQTIEQKDYLTRSEAERKFVTKEDFAFIKRTIYGVISAVLLGFVSLMFYLIQSGLTK